MTPSSGFTLLFFALTYLFAAHASAGDALSASGACNAPTTAHLVAPGVLSDILKPVNKATMGKCTVINAADKFIAPMSDDCLNTGFREKGAKMLEDAIAAQAQGEARSGTGSAGGKRCIDVSQPVKFTSHGAVYNEVAGGSTYTNWLENDKHVMAGRVFRKLDQKRHHLFMHKDVVDSRDHGAIEYRIDEELVKDSCDNAYVYSDQHGNAAVKIAPVGTFKESRGHEEEEGYDFNLYQQKVMMTGVLGGLKYLAGLPAKIKKKPTCVTEIAVSLENRTTPEGCPKSKVRNSGFFNDLRVYVYVDGQAEPFVADYDAITVTTLGGW